MNQGFILKLKIDSVAVILRPLRPKDLLRMQDSPTSGEILRFAQNDRMTTRIRLLRFARNDRKIENLKLKID